MTWMVVVMTVVMQGCRKEPVNNDMEGFWQLRQFVVKGTGEVVTCQRLYYGNAHGDRSVGKAGPERLRKLYRAHGVPEQRDAAGAEGFQGACEYE